MLFCQCLSRHHGSSTNNKPQWLYYTDKPKPHKYIQTHTNTYYNGCVYSVIIWWRLRNYMSPWPVYERLVSFYFIWWIKTRHCLSDRNDLMMMMKRVHETPSNTVQHLEASWSPVTKITSSQKSMPSINEWMRKTPTKSNGFMNECIPFHSPDILRWRWRWRISDEFWIPRG